MTRVRFIEENKGFNGLKEAAMKKTQLFPVVGFLMGWGAPAGALLLRSLWVRPISNPYGFLITEWSQNAFFYWYMLGGTCLVLTFTGYLLGKLQEK